MTVDEAIAEVRRFKVNHEGGKFVSPAIYRAADVLAGEVDRLRELVAQDGPNDPRPPAPTIGVVGIKSKSVLKSFFGMP